MIYFDNAATTLQKPAAVKRAVLQALQLCGNPGRSGHRPAMQAASVVFRCRQEAAELFGVANPEQIVFTSNATDALNIAIHSLVRCGGHAVISGFEHNSVVRPLESQTTCQFNYTVACSKLFNREDALKQIRSAIRPDTDFVACTAVSNVFGCTMPIYEIDRMCAAKGVALVLDLSQAAGVMDIDCSKLKSRCFCCMPGHKGLYGPQGTGILLCLNDVKPISLTHGGTGSNSADLKQPDFLPDMLESGTLNVPGIAGLLEGIRFVRRHGADAIGRHESELCRRAAEGIGNISELRAFSGPDQSGVISFVSGTEDPQELCEKMGRAGVCLRGGLHCAPLAHYSAGTMPAGTVRVSFSAFNSKQQIDRFLLLLQRTVQK